jgi:hypothetical protein
MSKYPTQNPPSYGQAVGVVGGGQPQRPYLRNALEILTSEMPVELENIAVKVADDAIESIRSRNGDLANSDLAKKISEDFGTRVGFGEWNCMVWSSKISGSDLNYWFRFGENSSILFELGSFVIGLYSQFHTVAEGLNNIIVVKTFMNQQMQNQTIEVVRDALQRAKRDPDFRPVAHIKDRMGDIFGESKRWQVARGPAHPTFDYEIDTDGDNFIELRVEDMAYLVFMSERSDY